MIDFYKDKDVSFTVDVFKFYRNYTIDLTNETIEVLNKINPKDTVVETKFWATDKKKTTTKMTPEKWFMLSSDYYKNLDEIILKQLIIKKFK